MVVEQGGVNSSPQNNLMVLHRGLHTRQQGKGPLM